MNNEIPDLPTRGRWQGTRQIVSYNWPFYAVALGAVAGARWAQRRVKGPRWMSHLSAAGSGFAVFWTLASVAASWWVYDRSALYRWSWLREVFPQSPQSWANIHCGLDESTSALRALFPGTQSQVLDIFAPHEMTEPAIRRARKLTPALVAATPSDYRALPLPDASLDAVFLLFAAHEIRARRGRERLFNELRRVLRPGRCVVLLEHTRDGANFAAFGPGFFHFFPRKEWRALAKGAGFVIERESAFTPFVRLFVLRTVKGES